MTAGVRRILGTGGYHTGEKWLVSTPVNRRAGSKLAVICHGAGSDGWYYGDLAARFRFTNMLARSGMVSVAADLGSVTEGSRDGWGNPTQVARINEVITWAASEWGCDTSRVWLLGDSAGGAGALNWARQNPNRVGAIALRAGVPDIDAIYLDGTGNGLLVALIDQAYGAGGLGLPGTSGAYASTPHFAALDVTDGIVVEYDVTLPSPLPSPSQIGVANWEPTGGGATQAWQVYVRSDGRLQIGWRNSATSTNNFPQSDLGAVVSGRRTYKIQVNATTGLTSFWWAPSWAGAYTAAGTSSATGGTLNTTTNPLKVGFGGPEPLLVGTMHRIRVSKLDATVLAYADFTASASGTTSFVDSTGRTWTINGAATLAPGWAYLSAAHNPADNTGELSPIADRIRFYYSTDDGLVPPASTMATAAAIGCELVSLGAVDHDPYPTFPDAQAAAWFWSKT